MKLDFIMKFSLIINMISILVLRVGFGKHEQWNNYRPLFVCTEANYEAV